MFTNQRNTNNDKVFHLFRYGGKRVFLTGIGATASLTLLTPILTKTGTGFLVSTRILEGLFEVSFALTIAVFLSYERNRFYFVTNHFS